MPRRQQYLAGRGTGYHQLARWVAARQPLSLAAPRVPLPLAPLSLTPLRNPRRDSPIDDTASWSINAESAFPPTHADHEPGLPLARVAAERPFGRSVSPAEPHLPPLALATSRDGARGTERPQRAGRHTVAGANIPTTPDERDDRATTALVPGASASPAPLLAVAPGNGDGHDDIEIPVPSNERTVPPPAREDVAPDDTVLGVEVVRTGSGPQHAAPVSPPPSTATSPSSLLAEETQVRDDEQRPDSRPLAPPVGDKRPDRVDITHVGITPRGTSDAGIAAVPAANTGAGAEVVPVVTPGNATTATPAVTTGDRTDVEIVVPRRPRPQPPFSAAPARAERLQAREDGAPRADTTATADASQTRASTPELPARQPLPENGVPLRSAADETPAGSQAEAEHEELFAPRRIDRSPETWLARLTGRAPAAQRPPLSAPVAAPRVVPGQDAAPVAETADRRPLTVATTPPAPVPTLPPTIGDATAPPTTTIAAAPSATPGSTPTVPPAPIAAAAPAPLSAADSPPPPLPDATRRFLQPLVGIDPASVRVYGDPAATQFAERANADAVAVGDIVALGAGHTPGVGSPETLGLLAHELTHVARWRAPRFVPPIARTTEHEAGSGREVAAPTNEEGLARLVEARVTRAAEATLTPEHRSPPLPFGAPVAPAAPSIADREPNRYADAEVVRTEADPGQQATGNDMSRAVPAAWNGLPAPWEPLPTWLDAPGPGAPTATPPPAASPATSVFSPQGAAAPAVQLAERGRTPDEATPATATGSAAPPAAQSPEPDLDALARQVYAVLRRRLSAEGRRAW